MVPKPKKSQSLIFLHFFSTTDLHQGHYFSVLWCGEGEDKNLQLVIAQDLLQHSLALLQRVSWSSRVKAGFFFWHILKSWRQRKSVFSLEIYIKKGHGL